MVKIFHILERYSLIFYPNGHYGIHEGWFSGDVTGDKIGITKKDIVSLTTSSCSFNLILLNGAIWSTKFI